MMSKASIKTVRGAWCDIQPVRRLPRGKKVAL